MKTQTNRIRVKGSGKVAALQVPKKPLFKQPLNASGIIEETELSLEELKRIGQSATAAVMMGAIQIESEDKEFSEGQLDLARHASRAFKSDFARLTASAAILLCCLRAHKNGTALPANPFADPVLLRPWCTISNALTGLSHLINLQEYAFGQLGIYNSHGLTFTLCKQLEAAEELLDKIFVPLDEAMKAIYSSANRPKAVANQ
jgi:hypothetical protein